MTRIPDVKRYLNSVSVASDGLLVTRSTLPFVGTCELIVVPRSILHGLLTALHIRFNHPSAHQLKKVFSRYFFALDTDKAIQQTCSSCHPCASLKTVPSMLKPQSSSPPPSAIGTSFAADVMRRYRQMVLVVRETVSSYTAATFIDNERRDSLRDALLILCSGMTPLGHSESLIRVDAAPGLQSLVSDPTLQRHGIQLIVGNPKNLNKNPVAEKAIRELGLELLNLSPNGGPISGVLLALATANLNSRIRDCGLSSREIWTQRDQITGDQLPLSDSQLADLKFFTRLRNHPASATSKAHGKRFSCQPLLNPGDIVYLYGDSDKTAARPRYMVISVTDQTCQVRKFTQSQFRSRLYDVPLQQCYKVTPTTLYQNDPCPIRGLDPTFEPGAAAPPLPVLHGDPTCREPLDHVPNLDIPEFSSPNTPPPTSLPVPTVPAEITGPSPVPLSSNTPPSSPSSDLAADNSVPRRSLRSHKRQSYLDDYETDLN